MPSTDTELRTLAVWIPGWHALTPIEEEITQVWRHLKELRAQAAEARAKLVESCPVDLSDLEIRFWSKVAVVDDEDSCWPWTSSSRNVEGENYGAFKWVNPLTGKSESPGAHRVALFLKTGAMPEVARHTCDTPICARPKHLIDGTHADNMQDRKERGRFGTPRDQRGEKNASAVLTEAMVIEARRLVKDYMSHQDVANQMGVDRAVLTYAVTGRTWAHLNEVEPPAPIRKGGTRLTEDDVRDIRKQRKEGVDPEVVAEQYGVTKANIYAIVKRKSWKHVV